MKPRVWKFGWEHLEQVEMVLDDLEGTRLTLSAEKSHFTWKEVVMLRHFCNAEGQLLEMSKVEAIN